jgi:VIT1/CCC1 family predicted Fe2+/Mn2+ transporter
MGSVLNALAGIALIVLGLRQGTSIGIRSKAGKQMILLGIVVLISTFMIGWPAFIEGLREGHRAG